jgi:acetyl esterase/lipase
MRRAQRLQITAGCSEVARLSSITMRLHRPTTPERVLPALLWMHGGGYVMGHAAQEDAFCRQVASELGMVVAAVDYRLAPEHPFPTPLHDCYEALLWLSHCAEIDRSRIAIGGASAGGGLAAALALLARDRDDIRPVFQLLRYPMLDDRTAAREDINERDVRLWNTRSNHFGWRCYLGTAPGADGIDGLAAAARAIDLSELAPAWLGVGSLDLFADETTMYAQRLQTAGVQCELSVVDGAFHGFDVVRWKAPVSRSFRAAQIRALRAALTQS